MAFADIGKEVVVQVDALLRFADIVTLYDIFKNHGIKILSKQRLFCIFFYTGYSGIGAPFQEFVKKPSCLGLAFCRTQLVSETLEL